MQAFPLAPFLATLEADGIVLTARDYERLQLVLQTGGVWSLARLRDTLLALLARDSDMQEVLLQRFNEFFSPDLQLERAFDGVDVTRVLADLRQIIDQPPTLSAQPQPTEPHVSPVRRQQRRRALRWWGWRIGVSTIALVGLIAAVTALWRPTWDVPPVATRLDLSVQPDRIDFHLIAVGETITRTFTLSNPHPMALTVELNIATQEPFALVADQPTRMVLHPSEAITIAVVCAPHEAQSGGYTAQIVISGEGLAPKAILLSAQSFLPGNTDDPLDRAKRRYPNVPSVQAQSIERPTFTDWWSYAAAAVALTCATLLYGLWLWNKRRIPHDEPPEWDRTRPRHFSLRGVGGPPPPLLDEETLSYLADSLGYFRSEEYGGTLDIATSIKRTMREAGIPQLAFQRRKRVRALLLLVDARAEATRWNTIPSELASGMARRGVSVTHGTFDGTLARFRTPDGALHHLEDLEDERNGYLALVFTDGKGVDRTGEDFSLEALACWPMVAWMELREPRSWDATTQSAARHGIPLYPASRHGVVQAVRSFTAEHTPAIARAASDDYMPSEPLNGGMESYIEHLLGDALRWAQACAMLQPMSQGLADSLRATFHPWVPAERIERIHALPETKVSVAGIHFAHDVLRILRHGFLRRSSEAEQEAVLRHILAEVKRAEPAETESMAHLAWESVYERVHLELDPDPALARLAALAESPLGTHIRAELASCGFSTQTDRIPLRCRPHSRDALQRLARLADGFAIPRLQAYPVALGHRVAFAALVLLTFGTVGSSVWRFQQTPSIAANLQIEAPRNVVGYLQVDGADGSQWGGPTLEESGPDQDDALTPKITYTSDDRARISGRMPEGASKLTLYGGGYWRVVPLQMDEPGHRMQLVVATQPDEQACHTASKEVGLLIERCAKSALPVGRTSALDSPVLQLPTWRDVVGERAGRRILSVGIELSSAIADQPELRRWREQLLATGSVDVIYRIQPVESGAWKIDEAVDMITADLGPILSASQLVWWSDGVIPPSTTLDKLVQRFDREFNVSTGRSLSWMEKLNQVFLAHKARLIDEGVLRQALDQPPPPVGQPLVLVGSTPAPTTPLPVWVPEMVMVPAGPFPMGSSDQQVADAITAGMDSSWVQREQPQHTLTLPAYEIGKTEVTNAQFRPFVDGDGYTNRAYWDDAGWQWRTEQQRTQPGCWTEADFNDDNQPVVCVTLYEAMAYARWLSTQTGQNFSLPTEAQWEKAARGIDGRIYPWGNTWDAKLANSAESGLGKIAQVGQYPGGASPYGALDMAGNAWEWTQSELQAYPLAQPTGETLYTIKVNGTYVLRGGSWYLTRVYARCAYRIVFSPLNVYVSVGFRLARLFSLP